MDDEPLTWWSSSSRVGRTPDVNVDEVYSENQRLAVEELVANGVGAYLGFLKKERVRNFLSDDEIQFILHSALAPKCATQSGDSGALVLPDATSLVYFPDISDVVVPELDIGWPVFPSNSSRGANTAVTHFQPNFTPNLPVECIYSCKEAARKMIKGAKEVIAIVTDTLTDIDIFRDLHEACSKRGVAVYILLDREAVPAFLQMCGNLDIRLAQLQKMRVRAVAGFRFFTRFGAHITGRIHEQFMLIDGRKVAMGTYRFRWTDGRINTCHLIELTGEVIEEYEQEFHRLYKKSLAVNTRGVVQSAFSAEASLTPVASPLSPKTVPSLAQALGVVLPSSSPETAADSATPPKPAAAQTISTRSASTQTDPQAQINQHRQANINAQPSSRYSLSPPSSPTDSTNSTLKDVSPISQMTASPLRTNSKHTTGFSPLSTQSPALVKTKPAEGSSGQTNSEQGSDPLATLHLKSGLQKGCKLQQSTRPGPGMTLGSMLMAMPVRSRFLQ